MNLTYNSDKFESCLNTYRKTFSDISTSEAKNPDQNYEASIMVPLDFSLEMDGISGIIPNSAFEIPADTLPNSYLTKVGKKSKIAFILHTIEHDFNNNKWTTKITGQTLNIRFDQLSDKDKAARNYIPPIVTPNPEQSLNPNPTGERADFWTLVAISAAEGGYSQGIADVAQSIYNRLGARTYGSSIKSIITAPNQYEPTKNNPFQWKVISSKESAIIAYQGWQNSTKAQALTAINLAYNAIQDSTLMQNAATFVGSRTEFLAYQPNVTITPIPVGMVKRTSRNLTNVFFWKYSGKSKFYNNGKPSPAQPKPSGFIFISNS
jgi:hypothetical protein